MLSKILVLQSVYTSTSQNNMRAPSTTYIVSPVPRLSWSFLKRWWRRKDLRSLHADRAVSLLTFVQLYSGGYTLVRRHKQGRWWWSPDFVSDCASLFHKCSCSLIGREGKVCVFVLLSAIRALEQCACVRLFSPSTYIRGTEVKLSGYFPPFSRPFRKCV